MRLQLQKHLFRLAAVSLLVWVSATFTMAQTTSFTYQGRLSDGVTPLTGTYDLQFTLWDASSGGLPQPQPTSVTVTRTSVLVTGGIFTVQLDFGASAFPGADRFLEIGVRLAGGGAFTILLPRQQITSTPYAIRSLNASSADAVTVSGVPVGSGNYIQNNPASPQAGNFNISGNGTASGTLSANIVNATTQYNIAGQKVFSIPGTDNTFAGVGAGANNTSGARNTAFGAQAGASNQMGNVSAYFGYQAGQNDITGVNAFFGGRAGRANVSGGQNSFFGEDAGTGNVLGSNNAYFGQAAGRGANGDGNSYFGVFAGAQDLTGNFNALIGYNTQAGQTNLTNAIAIGANSQVDQSNAMVLGSVAGFNSATTSVNVGIGTTAPQARLHVKGDTLVETSGSGGNIQLGTPSAETGMTINKAGISRADMRFDGSTLKLVAIAGPGVPAATSGLAITTAGRVGIGTTSPAATLEVRGQASIAGFRVLNSTGFTALVVRDDLTVAIGQLSSAPSSTHVCLDGTATLSFCTSSLRYKQQVAPYSVGLELIRRLRPISFTWKGNGTRDLGLGAEDVAKVEPLLVTHNNAGEIQGVKYDQLNVVLINAIKQQQDQIETLRTQNAALNARLRSVENVLRKRVGSSRRRH